MSDDPKSDAILTRFRTALGEVYGDRREGVARTLEFYPG
jgi:hypothetical protein